MTKQEKIQEAYGEYWDYFKDKQFDENGYSMFSELEDKHKIWENITLDSHSYANRVYRPTSLSGIENNNGWIKIESEADLPKDITEYDAILENTILRENVHLDRILDYFEDKSLTHFKIHKKQDLPIY